MKLINGDCLTELRKLNDNSVDTVITSPPYNKGRWRQRDFTKRKADTWTGANIAYAGFDDAMPPEQYAKWQTEVLHELVRVIKPTGSIFYNTKPLIYKHRLVYPAHVFQFNVRQQIIWDRGNSPSVDPIRWLPTTEYVFWITKSPVQPKFLGWKGKHKSEVWRIPPKPMKNHPAPFPEELVYECLVATTEQGDLVLDPFMGSGTTGYVARKHGRDFIGIELNPAYMKLAKERIQVPVQKPLIAA